MSTRSPGTKSPSCSSSSYPCAGRSRSRRSSDGSAKRSIRARTLHGPPRPAPQRAARPWRISELPVTYTCNSTVAGLTRRALGAILGAMRVTKAAVTPICAICERTLLMGERSLRFSPDGSDYVDVCPLCQEIALEHGWVKEGSPTTPVLAPDRRRRGRPTLARLLAPRRQATPAPVASAPILRRLSEPEQAVVEAADLFNASDYRRSVAGIAKSLGEPRVSIVRLSGTSGELVVTVAWEIS